MSLITFATRSGRVAGSLLDSNFEYVLGQIDVGTKIYTLSSFGAVGDGVTDDTTPITNALASGEVVTGGGLTYAVTNVIPPVGAFTGGFRDTRLKWLTPGVGRMLLIQDSNGFVIDNVKFDLQNPSNIGNMNDDGGLSIQRSVTGCSGFKVNAVEAFNGGPSTGLYFADADNFQVTNCISRDFRVDLGAGNDPTDDCIQLFRYDRCSNATISGNNAARAVVVLYNSTLGIYSNNPWLGDSKRWSRGHVFSGCSLMAVEGSEGSYCDEAFDFSGGLGNYSNVVANCKGSHTGSWGLKFSNSGYDNTVTNFYATDCGLGGIVVTGGTTGSGGVPLSRDIQFINCRSSNTGSDGLWHLTQIASVPAPTPVIGHSIRAGSPTTTYPRGIKFRYCSTIDRQAVPTTDYGFYQDSSLVATSPISTGYNIDELNEIIGCDAVGVNTFQQNFHFPFVQLRGSSTFTVADSTDTAVLWTGEDSDTAAMHSNSTNPEKIYAKKAGYYQISANIEWTANATGHRTVFFKVNGVSSALTDTQPGVAGFNTHTQTQITVYLEAGGFVECWVNQNSGGNLDINRDRSTFQATLLR